MPAEEAFVLTLDHGQCVGVRIPSSAEAVDALAREALLPDEVAHASTLPGLRRSTWVAGRVALRLALARAGIDAPDAIGTDDRGAPILPGGVSGSVSHKLELAVALAAREPAARLGVDVENDRPGTIDIGRKVLADDEQAELAPLDPTARAREVLLRFSAKEAVYKALDPFVRRYVGFHEVSVFPMPDGTARVTMRLPEGAFAVQVRWRRSDGSILTTARVMKPSL